MIGFFLLMNSGVGFWCPAMNSGNVLPCAAVPGSICHADGRVGTVWLSSNLAACRQLLLCSMSALLMNKPFKLFCCLRIDKPMSRFTTTGSCQSASKVQSCLHLLL